jgi:multidrug efflux pump
LGAKNQDTRCTLDGKPSIGLVIYQLPGSNALETADSIRAKMKDLAATRFPKGMHYSIVYDTTPFIKESVNEVFHALRDAVILVAIVVLLFLQDWKAMILPMIDVPVSLVGTFAVMYLMGFTLNNLTLFGLVLAIGIVVDDAIVVLEAVEIKLAQMRALPRFRRWARSPGPSSPSRWCCAPCFCPRRSSAGSAASFIGSSR